ncbi:hypothetical protein [Gymnodinialimonas sp.]
MEIMFWAFGALAAVVFVIIAVAAWVVFVRDKDAPNTRTRHKSRAGKVRRPSGGRGGPTRR